MEARSLRDLPLDQSQVRAKAAGRALLSARAKLGRVICRRIARDVVRARPALRAHFTSWAILRDGAVRVASRPGMEARSLRDLLLVGYAARSFVLQCVQGATPGWALAIFV